MYYLHICWNAYILLLIHFPGYHIQNCYISTLISYYSPVHVVTVSDVAYY